MTTKAQQKPYGWLHTLVQKLFSAFSYLVFHTYLRLKISGKEHLPKAPYIICSNHQSHLDGIILGYIGASDFSKVALIAAKDYWFDQKLRYRVSRFFFRIIPINRKETGGGFEIRVVTRMAQSFYDEGGKCVAILPEGTRSGQSRIKPFKKGVVILAKQLNVPIVPVYIDQSGRSWPPGRYVFGPGRLKVVIGTPIFPEEFDLEQGASYVRDKVLKLSV